MKKVLILILFNLLISLTYSQDIDTLKSISQDIYKGDRFSFLIDWTQNLRYPQKTLKELKFGTEIISIKIFPNKIEPELEIINSISEEADKEIIEAFQIIKKKFIFKNIKDTSIVFLPITFIIGSISYEHIPIKSKKLINEVNVVSGSDNIDNYKPDKELLELYQTAFDSNDLNKQLEILNELKRRNPLNRILIEEHLKLVQSLGLEKEVKMDKKLLELIDN